MSSIENDKAFAIEALVDTFKVLDKQLDYSIGSLQHIEALLGVEIKDGQPIKGGILKEGFGMKMFAVSVYMGEVILKNTQHTRWVFDESDTEGSEMNMQIVDDNGSIIWPMQKVLKRILNGPEDNLFHYTAYAVKQGFTPVENLDPKVAEHADDGAAYRLLNKPWWKFW